MAHACAVLQKEQRTNAKVWILMDNKKKHTVQGAVKRMYKHKRGSISVQL